MNAGRSDDDRVSQSTKRKKGKTGEEREGANGTNNKKERSPTTEDSSCNARKGRASKETRDVARSDNAGKQAIVRAWTNDNQPPLRQSKRISGGQYVQYKKKRALPSQGKGMDVRAMRLFSFSD